MEVRRDLFVIVSIIVPGIPDNPKVEKKDVVPAKEVIVGSTTKEVPDLVLVRGDEVVVRGVGSHGVGFTS